MADKVNMSLDEIIRASKARRASETNGGRKTVVKKQGARLSAGRGRGAGRPGGMRTNGVNSSKTTLLEGKHYWKDDFSMPQEAMEVEERIFVHTLTKRGRKSRGVVKKQQKIIKKWLVVRQVVRRQSSSSAPPLVPLIPADARRKNNGKMGQDMDFIDPLNRGTYVTDVCDMHAALFTPIPKVIRQAPRFEPSSSFLRKGSVAARRGRGNKNVRMREALSTPRPVVRQTQRFEPSSSFLADETSTKRGRGFAPSAARNNDLATPRQAVRQAQRFEPSSSFLADGPFSAKRGRGFARGGRYFKW